MEIHRRVKRDPTMPTLTKGKAEYFRHWGWSVRQIANHYAMSDRDVTCVLKGEKVIMNNLPKVKGYHEDQDFRQRRSTRINEMSLYEIKTEIERRADHKCQFCGKPREGKVFIYYNYEGKHVVGNSKVEDFKYICRNCLLLTKRNKQNKPQELSTALALIV